MARGFRRRRFKPKVQWLPNPGTDSDHINTTDVAQHWAGTQFDLTTGQLPVTVEFPLVLDNPVQETVTGSSVSVWQKFALNQTEDWTWRLRRIVGDLFLSLASSNTQAITAPAVLVEAGIIVRRVETETGQSLGAAADTDVGNLGNNPDPWVWRRNWILSPPGAQGTTYGTSFEQSLTQFPAQNVDYGSALTGTRIDQKTNRRIGVEERLFMDITAWEMPIAVAASIRNTSCHLSINFDYRVLGTVQASRGNRRNASR